MDNAKTKEIIEVMWKLKDVYTFSNVIDGLPFRELMVMRMIDCHIKHHIGSELIGNKNGIKVTTLSEQLGISKSGVSQILNILEAKQLIERITTKDDRRVVYVILSELGSSTLKTSNLYINEAIGNAFGKMGSDDTENFIRLLNKLYDIMKSAKDARAVC